MHLTEDRIAALSEKARLFRIDVLKALHHVQSGHPGGSLSMTEILTVLYLEKLHINVNDPTDLDVDHVVLSKGHGVPMLYRLLAEVGYFPLEELMKLRQVNALLQGHPTNHIPGIDIPSGPLGAAFGAAQGLALSQRLNGLDRRTYAIIGDGEMDEGAIWEVAMSASKFKLDNLIAILDYNKVQLDGTNDEIMPLGDVPAKWRDFGWNVIECDGHSVADFSEAIDQACAAKGRPNMIIAHTVKGKCVSFMEGQCAWHGKSIPDDLFQVAIKELGGDK